MPGLYLIDIDYTLIDATNFHIKAYQLAYKSLFGKEVPRGQLLPLLGLSEAEIHRSLFQQQGILDFDSQLENVLGAYQDWAEKIRYDSSLIILKGTLNLLNALRERKEIAGIVTSNPERVGKILLEKSSLMPFFHITSYGDNGIGKTEIVRNAILQADENGLIYEKKVVIGDSIADIEASLANNAFAVGVATGKNSKEQLRQAGAHLVLDSLLQYAQIFSLGK